MKHTPSHQGSRRSAFTLIELLVVIAIIAALAAMLFPVIGKINQNKRLKVAKAELEQIVTAIDAYKVRYGSAPPDNPGNPKVNTLYFELVGTTNNGAAYQTLDGGAVIPVNQLTAVFGTPPAPAQPVSGFVNTATSLRGGDEGKGPETFLKNLRPTQVAKINVGGNTINGILVCSVQWSDGSNPQLPTALGADANANPFQYNSSTPTNSSGSYDLWVDIIVNGKTNRISNWSKDPQIVP